MFPLKPGENRGHPGPKPFISITTQGAETHSYWDLPPSLLEGASVSWTHLPLFVFPSWSHVNRQKWCLTEWMATGTASLHSLSLTSAHEVGNVFHGDGFKSLHHQPPAVGLVASYLIFWSLTLFMWKMVKTVGLCWEKPERTYAKLSPMGLHVRPRNSSTPVILTIITAATISRTPSSDFLLAFFTPVFPLIFWMPSPPLDIMGVVGNRRPPLSYFPSRHRLTEMPASLRSHLGPSPITRVLVAGVLRVCMERGRN